MYVCLVVVNRYYIAIENTFVMYVWWCRLSLSSVSILQHLLYMLAFIADVSIRNVCIYCYLICNTVDSLFQLCMYVCM